MAAPAAGEITLLGRRMVVAAQSVSAVCGWTVVHDEFNKIANPKLNRDTGGVSLAGWLAVSR